MFRLLVLLRKTAKNGQIYEAVICATAENGRFHCFFRMAVICDNENDSRVGPTITPWVGYHLGKKAGAVS